MDKIRPTNGRFELGDHLWIWWKLPQDSIQELPSSSVVCPVHQHTDSLAGQSMQRQLRKRLRGVRPQQGSKDDAPISPEESVKSIGCLRGIPQ